MEGILITAFTWTAIWWVVTNYVELGIYMLLPQKFHVLNSLVCWKCFTFLGTLALTFNLPMAATSSLFAVLLDAYLSNKETIL